MNEYLKDIKKAIENVDGEYCTWEDWKYIAKELKKDQPDNDKQEKVLKMMERVFCYEFYHQFRLLMGNDRYKDKSKNKKLIFSAEITKYYLDSMKADTSHHIYFPDFVLHSGQDNVDRQEVVIEVKTSERIKQNQSGNNLNTDIEKLVNLTKEGSLYKYQMGVFIAVNMSTDELKERIDVDRFKREKEENKKRIYLIGTRGDFITLEDICPSQK